MIKNTWYTERKKLSLEKEIFRWIVIGCFFYTLISSILFMVEYLIPERWDELVNNNLNRFTSGVMTYQESSDLLKIVYLSKFWGTIGLILLLQLMAYLYLKKIKHGFLFPILWIALIIGMIVMDAILMKTAPLIYTWKLIPLILLLIPMTYLIKEMSRYRKDLNKRFYLKVKKGEL